MSGCDIQNGRFIEDCQEKRAGIRTVFFFRHYLLGRINRNTAGEIIYFGNGLMFRFEQDTAHGAAFQELIKGNDLSQYVQFKIQMSASYATPEYLETINAIKAGSWAIFYLTYDGDIRFMGETTPMKETGSLDGSGETADGLKYVTMEFEGIGEDYAPYLAPFTKYPFDNFPILVVPQYVATFKKLLINSVDRLSINNFGDKLSYG